jgi:MFS family permease
VHVSQYSRPGAVGRPADRAGARRATTLAFAAQGMSVAAVYTTVPAVTEHLRLSPLLTTATLVGVALTAGAGSFLGLAAVRVAGPVATMRGALLTAAVALTLIGWAPGTATVICAYVLFGLAVGALDVGINTRAAAIERAYGRSVFGSFYTAWSVGGVLAALLTAGAARLDRPVGDGLAVQAGVCWSSPSACARTPFPPPKSLPRTAAVGAPVCGCGSSPSGWSSSSSTSWTRPSPPGRRCICGRPSTRPSRWRRWRTRRTRPGTVVGRATVDRLVQRVGTVAVVRTAALVVAGGLAGMATAPSWPFAVLAAGVVGLGASVLAPLCLASAARLRPGASETVLARLNLFNYAGVVTGGAVSGLLGSTGEFRLAYAAPAALAVLVLAGARHFTQPPGTSET